MQQFFYIRTKNKYVQIKFSEIIYGEGKRNFVKLVTSKKAYLVTGMVREVMEELPANLFCRIHKSYIVAIEHVKEFDVESIYLNDGVVLPIGNYYRNEFKKRIKIIGKYSEQKKFLMCVSDKSVSTEDVFTSSSTLEEV